MLYCVFIIVFYVLMYWSIFSSTAARVFNKLTYLLTYLPSLVLYFLLLSLYRNDTALITANVGLLSDSSRNWQYVHASIEWCAERQSGWSQSVMWTTSAAIRQLRPGGWIVSRCGMCATFWCGVICILSSIILLVTSRHKGRYRHRLYQHSFLRMS